MGTAIRKAALGMVTVSAAGGLMAASSAIASAAVQYGPTFPDKTSCEHAQPDLQRFAPRGYMTTCEPGVGNEQAVYMTPDEIIPQSIKALITTVTTGGKL